MGNSLKGESDAEEKEKIDRRLEGLANHFGELQQAAQDRMKGPYRDLVSINVSNC